MTPNALLDYNAMHIAWKKHAVRYICINHCIFCLRAVDWTVIISPLALHGNIVEAVLRRPVKCVDVFNRHVDYSQDWATSFCRKPNFDKGCYWHYMDEWICCLQSEILYLNYALCFHQPQQYLLSKSHIWVYHAQLSCIFKISSAFWILFPIPLHSIANLNLNLATDKLARHPLTNKKPCHKFIVDLHGF